MRSGERDVDGARVADLSDDFLADFFSGLFDECPSQFESNEILSRAISEAVKKRAIRARDSIHEKKRLTRTMSQPSPITAPLCAAVLVTFLREEIIALAKSKSKKQNECARLILYVIARRCRF